MKKIIISILVAMMVALFAGCTNPNVSTTDKVGGYHTNSFVSVEASEAQL